MLKCGEIKAGFNFQRPDEDRVDVVGALSLPIFPFMVNSQERETGDDMLRYDDDAICTLQALTGVPV
jgi:hypothetical protein